MDPTLYYMLVEYMPCMYVTGDMAPEKDSSEKQRQTAQSCGASKTVAKLNILDTYTGRISVDST